MKNNRSYILKYYLTGYIWNAKLTFMIHADEKRE